MGRLAEWLKYRLKRRSQKARLHNLTPDEKRLLRRYVQGNTKSVNVILPIEHTIQGLVNDGILRISAGDVFNDHYSEYREYTVHIWVWNYLRANPELLE
jgi:hypothetical protein